jgi:hypothetical protein
VPGSGHRTTVTFDRAPCLFPANESAHNEVYQYGIAVRQQFNGSETEKLQSMIGSASAISRGGEDSSEIQQCSPFRRLR